VTGGGSNELKAVGGILDNEEAVEGEGEVDKES